MAFNSDWLKISPFILIFFEKFEEKFGFRINDCITIAQSDQGGSLISAISDLGMDHILEWIIDFNDLLSQYNKAWKDLNEDDLGNLRKYLS